MSSVRFCATDRFEMILQPNFAVLSQPFWNAFRVPRTIQSTMLFFSCLHQEPSSTTETTWVMWIKHSFRVFWCLCLFNNITTGKKWQKDQCQHSVPAAHQCVGGNPTWCEEHHEYATNTSCGSFTGFSDLAPNTCAFINIIYTSPNTQFQSYYPLFYPLVLVWP